MLEECFRVEGRKTWYEDTAQLQADLDRFLEYYNLRRTHRGYRLKGRTPAQALAEFLGVDLQIVASTLHPPREKEDCDEINVAA